MSRARSICSVDLTTGQQGRVGIEGGDAGDVRRAYVDLAAQTATGPTIGTDTVQRVELEGGPGRDSAGYRRAPAGVRVDLALQDQEPDTRGAGIDTLRGIEGLSGSRFADRLLGESARGGPGRDRVVACER